MRESIRGYVDAVVEDVGAAGIDALADELAGLHNVLDANNDLRFILVDPGMAAHVRRGVLTDLLRSHVDEATLGLITFVVEADHATEFADDIAWLATRAAAGRDHLMALGAGPLGRTAATDRLDGYGSAVLAAMPDRSSLSEVEDELFRFSRVVDGSEELQSALTDMDLPPEVRGQLVSDLLASKVSPTSTRLACYITKIGRPRDYIDLLTAVIDRVAKENDRRIAEVRAVIELTGEQVRRLGAALAQITGHQVDVRVIVDPRVLGGFVATIGDAVVDGSARHRLDLLRERLLLPEANVTT